MACIAIGSVALYGISLILTAVIVLLLSALLAYFIYPLVQFLQRRLTRPLAIFVAFLLVAGVLAVVMFIVASSINPQVASLAKFIQFLMSPAGERRIQSFIDFLGKFGITKDQVGQLKNQLFSQAQGALSGLLPFLIGLFSNILDFIIVITLSVYFVLDGPRIIRWLSYKTPENQRGIITFLLRTLDQSLGGYFRGTLLLALGGALCTGVVLALLHVPYAALLAVLFFLLYFLPVIGTYMIAALCILAALSQGWVVMLIVAVFWCFSWGLSWGRYLRHAFSAVPWECIPLWPFSRSSQAQNSSDCLEGSSLYLLLAYSSRSSWQSGTDGNTNIPKNSRQKSYRINNQRCCQNKRSRSRYTRP